MTELTVRAQCAEALHDLEKQRVADVLVRCQRILSAYPKHVRTYNILGRAHLELGNHDEAANLFRRVLGADPEDTVAFASLGVIYKARGLHDEAIWQLMRALELSPRNVHIRGLLSELIIERERMPSRRIKMTRGALARTYLRAGLLPKAIGELRRILDTEPRRLDLRAALVEALWQDGRLSDAEAVAQGILQELPNCLKANLILGRMWLHTDRDDKARRLLGRAQALDPENLAAHALLGTDSPLPVRVARLPFEESDVVDDPDLPYLVDDEQVVTVRPIVDNAPRRVVRGGAGWQAMTLTTVRGHDEQSDDEDYSPPEAQTDTEGEPSDAPTESGRIQSVPIDHVARLARARALAADGQVDAALVHYALLLQERRSVPDVRRDLYLLHEKHPQHQGVSNLRAGSPTSEAARSTP